MYLAVMSDAWSSSEYGDGEVGATASASEPPRLRFRHQMEWAGVAAVFLAGSAALTYFVTPWAFDAVREWIDEDPRPSLRALLVMLALTLIGPAFLLFVALPLTWSVARGFLVDTDRGRDKQAVERLYPRTSLMRVVAIAIPTLVLAAVAYGGWLLWGADHHVVAVFLWVALVVPVLILLLDWLDVVSNLVYNPVVDAETGELESEVTKEQRAAAWEEADERTRRARDWLLRHLDRGAESFEWEVDFAKQIHGKNAAFYAGPPADKAAAWRAACLQVAQMYPTDPLLERLVALDDKGVGARMKMNLGHDHSASDRDGSNLLSAIIKEGEEWWGLRPAGRTEHQAWGWLDKETDKPLPLPSDDATPGLR